MGAGASKEELVYMAVQRGDLNGVRALRQQGASLEYRDSKGRTPLMLACSRAEAFEAAHLLLQLGADIRAYAKGSEGGTPIHFAARRKLTRTLEMLLNYGADPLQPNDLGKSALDLARDQHLSAMVQLIESRAGLFSGLMRQHFLSNAIIKMLIPQWVTRIVRVVVLPVARGSPNLILAIYPTAEAAAPQSNVLLAECNVSLTHQNSPDPKCVILNNRTGEKLKFTSEPPEQPQSVFRFYNACRGLPQTQGASGNVPYGAWHQYPPQQPPPPPQQGARPTPQQPATSLAKPSPPTGKAAAVAAQKGSQLDSYQSGQIDDDTALKLAIEESKKTASGRSQGSQSGGSYNGWGDAAPVQETYSGWGDSVPVGTPAAAAAAAAVGASAAASKPSATPPQPGAQPAPPQVTAEGRANLDSWAGPSSGSEALGGWALPATCAAGAGPGRVPPSAPTQAGSAASAPAPSAVAQATGGPTSASAPPSRAGNPFAEGAAGAPLGAPFAPAPPTQPSAPSLYPSIDTTPVLIDYSTIEAVATADPPAVAPPPELNPQYSEERVKEELKKAEGKQGGGQCVICWDAPAEAVCVPCGHIAGCMECLAEVKAKDWGCPVCRTKIDNVIKVFQV